MKKFAVLSLIFMLFSAGAALAQMEPASSMWVVNGHVGYGLPLGNFSDGFDGAFVAGAGVCYMFTNMYGLELGADWDKFPTKASSDVTWQFIPVTVDLVVNLPMSSSPIKPYIKGGVGMYFETAEVKVLGVKVSDSTNDFGVNIGAGIKFPVAETTSIDIGARFHNVMTESESSQYMTFTAGVGFMF